MVWWELISVWPSKQLEIGIRVNSNFRRETELGATGSTPWAGAEPAGSRAPTSVPPGAQTLSLGASLTWAQTTDFLFLAWPRSTAVAQSSAARRLGSLGEATCSFETRHRKSLPPSRARLGLAPLPGRKVTEPLSDRQPCAIWKREQKASEQASKQPRPSLPPARLPCPSLSPEVCSNSHPLN